MDVLFGRGELGRSLEHHRARDVDEPLDTLVDRDLHDRAGQRVVDMTERVWELVEVRDPAADRRGVDHMRATGQRRRRFARVAEVAYGDLAALPHPVRRRAMVGYPHLPFGVAEQAPDDRRADRPGTPGNKYARQFGCYPRSPRPYRNFVSLSSSSLVRLLYGNM
jgi:hypothetical protein